MAPPSKSMRKAVHRRAAVVCEKLAARGLTAYLWKKKLDRDLSRGLIPDMLSVRSESRCCAARLEDAAAVNKRSSDGRRRRSPPPIPAVRDDVAEEAKETAFLLGQARLRAETRLAAGRPRPMDKLVASLHGARRCALEAFRGASMEELRELGDEIAAHAALDRDNAPFWEAAKAMCYADADRAAGERLLHPAILADVRSIVQGKDLQELDAMQRTIAAKMAAGEDKVAEHWQGVAELIRIEKASRYLERYSSIREAAPPSPERGTAAAAAAADEEGPQPLHLHLAALTRPGCKGTRPEYVARVQLGYDWRSRYNRLHYDHDHPPPKVVTGYKFLVYYPDLRRLAAGARPPQYAVDEDKDSRAAGETCIISFRGGRPYEDIAFRIVNKEWDYSRRKGFRFTFDDRGVLRLEFRFKRCFYRR